jgi:hypothetical protein
MKVKIVDVKPGELFESESSLVPGQKSIFLKLHEQRVVNMDTFHMCKLDQSMVVQVLNRKLVLV